MAIASGQIAARVQSFDQPAEGGLSPRNANYQMDVRLDHATHTLKGRQTLRWRNISAHETSELQFHLYWNAWRDRDSTWMRERWLGGNRTPPRDDAWGSIDIESLEVRQANSQLVVLKPGWNPAPDAARGPARFIAPDDDNSADRTVLAVTLPQPAAPNETVTVDIEWTSKVPRTFSRTGYIDDYYFIAHWFPKIGVLEDNGWNTHQFHSPTEFYADFGVYDVGMTVPRSWLLGASGREVSRADNADGTTTHRYRGEDIHDFAWTTSPDFVEATQTFTHPTLPPVEMKLLLQTEHAGQEQRHFAATAAALKYYGEWFGPYPYGYITVIDPAYQSGSAGMEYPTLFTAGTRWIAPDRVSSPESVTIHEAGHQFFYGIVATNEFESAWMDEGLNQFADARALEAGGFPDYLSRRYFGGFVPWVFDDIRLSRATEGNGLAGYRLSPEGDVPATHTFRYWPGTATRITYFKTALWLHTLERHLGWPVLQRIMATYFDRWKFRHPRPDDFFQIANEISGQDLSWFFNEVFRSSNTFDYAVQELASLAAGKNQRTSVVVQRLGEAVFPVDVLTTFADGSTTTERWDGRARRQIYVYDRPTAAVSAQVDPKHVLLLDVNRTNNSRATRPRADEASLKWALTWMVWLQDLMLTYGFFV